MRTREIIKLMPTQYRQTTSNPLDSGHFIPLLGYWTKDEGYVKKQSLQYQGKSLACPIIAVVNRRVGSEDLSLDITAKVSEYSSTEEKAQGDYTIERKTYTPTETTVQTTLTVPRFTRQWATFLLTGLGKMVYEITSIDDEDVLHDTSRIEFYALASAGSRIIYWLGLHRVVETLRDIVQGPWIAPTKCLRCSGTGVEPDTVSPCEQCLGYGYSGYNASKYIQRMKGFDVGLARQVLDWDSLTDSDHTIIKEFINKAWTQKWWVTPTVSEIKRLFAHFFQLPLGNIQVEERFHLQEPVWTLNLPRRASASSPFGREMYENYEELLKYIARSITPAGVSVFVGFYDIGSFGSFEFYTTELKMHHLNLESCAFGQNYKLLLTPRWAFWNGWTNALDHFERCTGQTTGQVGGIWTSTGQVSIANVNDQNRHMVKFTNDCYIEHDISGVPTGQFDFWIHPENSEIRVGLADNTGFAGYITYRPDNTGFYDNWGNVIKLAMPHSDYHVRLDFVTDATGAGSTGQYGYIEQIQINRIAVGTGFNFMRSLGPNPRVRFHNTGQGIGFMDAYGNDWMTPQSGYQKIGDNYQRLYPAGFGICNRKDIDSGLYLGSFSFEDDDNGSVPEGWTDSSTGTCTVKVISGKTLDGEYHRKVVECVDEDGSGIIDLKYTFDAQEYGTIELWIGFSDKADIELSINLGGSGVRYIIRENDWYHETFGPPGQEVIGGIAIDPEVNHWHHLQMFWRGNSAPEYKGLSVNNYKLVVDGDESSAESGGPFDDCNKLHIYSTNAYTGTVWIDAVGNVEDDENYTEGDNEVHQYKPTGLHDIYIRKDKFWDKLIISN